MTKLDHPVLPYIRIQSNENCNFAPFNFSDHLQRIWGQTFGLRKHVAKLYLQRWHKKYRIATHEFKNLQKYPTQASYSTL